jgi:hypothetical protein
MTSYARLSELAIRHEPPMRGESVAVELTSRSAFEAAGTLGVDARQPLRISCEECTMHATSACADCVVTFICGREPDDAVIIDASEARALRLLAGAGLVPGLRHARTVGAIW